MMKCLQESRMREIRTSGSTRGRAERRNSLPSLSTLLVKLYSLHLPSLFFAVKHVFSPLFLYIFQLILNIIYLIINNAILYFNFF